jgi:hypothetical protein
LGLDTAPHFFDYLGAHKQEGGAFIAQTIKEMEVNCIIHLSPAKNCHHNPERHVKRTTNKAYQATAIQLAGERSTFLSVINEG